MVDIAVGTKYRLFTVTGNVYTELGTAGALTPAVGHVVNLEIVGTTLTLRVDGSVVRQEDIGASPETTGNPYLFMDSGDTGISIVDNWSAGSATAGEPPPPPDTFVTVQIRAA